MFGITAQKTIASLKKITIVYLEFVLIKIFYFSKIAVHIFVSVITLISSDVFSVRLLLS